MFSRRAESMNVIDGTKFLCEPKWGAAGFFLAAPIFLSLAPDRRSFRIFDLHPMR
jgi:hypothetical protein